MLYFSEWCHPLQFLKSIYCSKITETCAWSWTRSRRYRVLYDLTNHDDCCLRRILKICGKNRSAGKWSVFRGFTYNEKTTWKHDVNVLFMKLGCGHIHRDRHVWFTDVDVTAFTQNVNAFTEGVATQLSFSVTIRNTATAVIEPAATGRYHSPSNRAFRRGFGVREPVKNYFVLRS